MWIHLLHILHADANFVWSPISLLAAHWSISINAKDRAQEKKVFLAIQSRRLIYNIFSDWLTPYFSGLALSGGNSRALAMELPHSGAKPSNRRYLGHDIERISRSWQYYSSCPAWCLFLSSALPTALKNLLNFVVNCQVGNFCAIYHWVQ